MAEPTCKTMIAELICLWSVLLGIATCRPMHETDEQHSEYVTVERLSGNIQRNRRSSENEFPLKTIFRFKMTTSHVVIDLHLSEHVGRDVPVYTISNTGIDLRSIEKQDNYAVYQDVSSGASVLVKYPYGSRSEEFQLLGEFIHNGSHYQIEPATSFHRTKRDDVTSGSRDRRHVVRRQTIPHSGDFNGDTLIPPAYGDGVYAPMHERASLVLPNEQEVAENVLPLKVMKQDDKERPSEHYKLSTPPTAPQSSNSRNKREAEPLYIEYLVVADYRNFQRWKEKVSGVTEEERTNNAFTAMSEFYHYIVNGIDLRFRTATGSGPEIRVIFKSLLVSTEEATSPWLQGNKLGETTVDDAGMLLDFALWRNSVYDYLPEHDHAGLFTGFDLATLYSTSPIGMGYLNSVCNTAWAVSETEENYSATTVHIAAHELGHNLGSQHDGSGNGCSSSALNLMAPRLPFVYNPAVRANPWTFSTCSQTAIRSYVSGLGSDSCLINKPSYMTESEPGDDGELAPAGLKYSPDEQCNMTYGQDAVLCRENFHGQWDALCYAMQCRKRGSAYCEDRAFPFDHTPCGDKKWCRAGQCVYSEVAPSRHPTCPHGDDPNSSCSPGTSCDGTDMRSRDILCCGTCLGLYNTTTTSTTPTPGPTTSVLSVSTSSSTSQSSSLTTTEANSTPTSSTLSTTTSSVPLTISTYSPTSYNVSSPSTTDMYSSSSAKSSTTPNNLTTLSASSGLPNATSLTTGTSTQSSLSTTTVIEDSTNSSTEPSSTSTGSISTSNSPVTSYSTSTTTHESSSYSNNASSATVSTFPENSTISASVSTENVSTRSTGITTELLNTTITSNITSTIIPLDTTSVASTLSKSTGNSSTPVTPTHSGTTSSAFPVSSSTTSEQTPTDFTLANTTSTMIKSTSSFSTTISTSNTVPVSTPTTTQEQEPPTEESKTELSLKLQTLASLFMAAAIVV